MKVSFNQLRIRNRIDSSWGRMKEIMKDKKIKVRQKIIDYTFLGFFHITKDLKGVRIGVVNTGEAVFVFPIKNLTAKRDITVNPALISNSYNFELKFLALAGDKSRDLTIPEDEYPVHFQKEIKNYFLKKLEGFTYLSSVTVTPKQSKQELKFEVEIKITKV